MTLVGFGSAKGAPGVTTTVLALGQVWPEVSGSSVLVAECDPSGSSVAAGLMRGAAGSAGGLLGLSTSRVDDAVAALWASTVALDDSGTRFWFPGVPGPAHAPPPPQLWGRVARACCDLRVADPGGGGSAGVRVDVLADLGRLGASAVADPLRVEATRLVLVCGSDLGSVAAARESVAWLRRDDPEVRVGVVVVGPGRPYPAGEVAAGLGVRLDGVMPFDTRSARVFSHGDRPGWGFARSSLLRAAAQLARHLFEDTGDAQSGVSQPSTVDAAAPARWGRAG